MELEYGNERYILSTNLLLTWYSGSYSFDIGIMK